MVLTGSTWYWMDLGGSGRIWVVLIFLDRSRILVLRAKHRGSSHTDLIVSFYKVAH